jgi:membrane fusion protein (multidrug efflux system)
MKRILLFIFVFMVLAGLTCGLGYFQFVQKPELVKAMMAKAAPPLPTVAVAEARTETWSPRLPAIGTFRAFQGIDFAPQVGGIVEAIHIDSGQDVEKGARLFDIDSSVEKADLKNNLATLKNTELALDRQRQLNTGGNTTKANVDAAEAARDNAAASVERARATIAQKTLIAPFAGRLGIRKIDVGQYVSSGMSTITLQQLDPIFVDFPVPEQSLADLKPGEPVEVTVDSYPGKIFRGKIKTVDARVSQDTRNILVRAEFENKDKKLLPGMFANVDVVAGSPAKVVTVPRTAVTYSLYGDSIYVVRAVAPTEGGAKASPVPGDFVYQLERRFIHTGEARESRVSIADGISPGETVVAEGQLKLQPNSRVKIDPDARIQPPAILPKE